MAAAKVSTVQLAKHANADAWYAAAAKFAHAYIWYAAAAKSAHDAGMRPSVVLYAAPAAASDVAALSMAAAVLPPFLILGATFPFRSLFFVGCPGL